MQGPQAAARDLQGRVWGGILGRGSTAWDSWESQQRLGKGQRDPSKRLHTTYKNLGSAVSYSSWSRRKLIFMHY